MHEIGHDEHSVQRFYDALDGQLDGYYAHADGARVCYEAPERVQQRNVRSRTITAVVQEGETGNLPALLEESPPPPPRVRATSTAINLDDDGDALSEEEGSVERQPARFPLPPTPVARAPSGNGRTRLWGKRPEPPSLGGGCVDDDNVSVAPSTVREMPKREAASAISVEDAHAWLQSHSDIVVTASPMDLDDAVDALACIIKDAWETRTVTIGKFHN